MDNFDVESLVGNWSTVRQYDFEETVRYMVAEERMDEDDARLEAYESLSYGGDYHE